MREHRPEQRRKSSVAASRETKSELVYSVRDNEYSELSSRKGGIPAQSIVNRYTRDYVLQRAKAARHELVSRANSVDTQVASSRSANRTNRWTSIVASGKTYMERFKESRRPHWYRRFYFCVPCGWSIGATKRRLRSVSNERRKERVARNVREKEGGSVDRPR